MPLTHILTGDARQQLTRLRDNSIHCVVTSPPYFRIRDYGVAGQLGQEATPADFADALSGIFAELRRVLREDGSCWLNLGDTYAAGGNGGGGSLVKKRPTWHGAAERKGWRRQPPGFKQKDITLAPFVVADMLRADGWYLRAVVIWSKGNAAEPPRLDRPSVAHEYVFLLSKAEHYAVRDPGEPWFRSTVWTIQPAANRTTHPAVMPDELARRCIVCSTKENDIVLDPFCGAGTVGVVCKQHRRHFIGIDLNPSYVEMAQRRIAT